MFATQEKVAEKNTSSFADPSFASNKTLPVHRWVPWIAGFASGFVREVIESQLSSPGVVMDPFAGVGTTLVEASFLGHDVIGFEINPYAALACRVKIDAGKLDSSKLRNEADRLSRFFEYATSNGYVSISKAPSGFRTRREFYSQAVLRKVLIIQDFIDQINNERIRDVFRVAFASTMVRYSNYSYEPSLGTRSAAGKSDIEDFPVLKTITDKLGDIASDVDWLARKTPAPGTRARIIAASFFDCHEYIDPASVDLVITSPPYLNNYHYIRNTRPHLYWLGFAEKPKDTKPLENLNFGKYWQTVRDLQELKLNFPNPPLDITEKLVQLRSLNTDRGVYGGNGWANYAAAYFNDCYRFVQGLRHTLKPGGSAFVVIGNSILQGVMIPTDVYFGQIAECLGLEIIDIHLPRDTRVGNSIIQSNVRVGTTKDSHRLYEAVVELRQPR